MAWEYKGLLLPAPVPVDWAVSHAALPHAHLPPDGPPRLYFSSRDEWGRSHIGSAELDVTPTEAAVRVDPHPLLDPGKPLAVAAPVGALGRRRGRGLRLRRLGHRLGLSLAG